MPALTGSRADRHRTRHRWRPRFAATQRDPPVPTSPPYPSGVPLTDVMEFIAGDGSCWRVYIETIPCPPPRRWRRRRTLLPARRLRFDSASELRATTVPVPAGAPFLTEVRLQELLDQSAPLHASDLSVVPRPDARRRMLESAARLPAAVLAQGRGRWSHGEELVAGAADRLIMWVAGLLRGRPRPRF